MVYSGVKPVPLQNKKKAIRWNVLINIRFNPFTLNAVIVKFALASVHLFPAFYSYDFLHYSNICYYSLKKF